jgi:hypothetical protein
MSDIVHALGISAGILFFVVILIVIVSITAVNRGAAEMESEHGHTVAEVPVSKESSGVAAAAAPAKAAKPGAPPVEEISVIQILLFGTGLFVVTVILLLALSLIEHMG